MADHRIRTVTLCAVQFIDVMGVTVVVAALPRMLAAVHGSATDAGLLVPAYAVGFGGFLLLGARLGDRYGPRRVLLGGLALFALGCVLCAAAQAPAWLLAGRFLQGAGAATSVPNALVLLMKPVGSGKSRDRALSAWNATGGLAGASGLLVGGLVTSSLGWRVIFWASLGAVAVLALVLARLVSADEPSTTERKPLNLMSIVLQILSVAAIVAAANAVTDSWLVAGLLMAVAAVVVPRLLLRERRTATRLVPAAIRLRPRVLAGIIGSFGVTATTSPLVVLTTLYFQDVRGLGPAGAGLMILPFSFAVVGGAAAAGRLLQRATPRTVLLVGLATIGTGAFVAAWHPRVVVVLSALVLAGAGNGIGAVAAYALGTAVESEEQATATGLLNTAAQLGTAVMVAVAIGVATATGDPLNHRAGWLTVGLTAALTGLACQRLEYRLPKTAERDHDEVSDGVPGDRLIGRDHARSAGQGVRRGGETPAAPDGTEGDLRDGALAREGGRTLPACGSAAVPRRE